MSNWGTPPPNALDFDLPIVLNGHLGETGWGVQFGQVTPLALQQQFGLGNF